MQSEVSIITENIGHLIVYDQSFVHSFELITQKQYKAVNKAGWRETYDVAKLNCNVCSVLLTASLCSLSYYFIKCPKYDFAVTFKLVSIPPI